MDWGWNFLETSGAISLVVAICSYFLMIVLGGARPKTRINYVTQLIDDKIVYNVEYLQMVCLSFVSHLMAYILLPGENLTQMGWVLLFSSAFRVIFEYDEYRDFNLKTSMYGVKPERWYITFDIFIIILSVLYLHFFNQYYFRRTPVLRAL